MPLPDGTECEDADEEHRQDDHDCIGDAGPVVIGTVAFLLPERTRVHQLHGICAQFHELIEKGEFVAIIGHTGSGKSTLIQHLNGLLHPTKGKALLDGTDLSGKTKEARAARGKVGMVFQYPEHQLFAETVYEDVAFGPRNLGLTEDEVEQRVREALQFVGLDYGSLAQRSPFNLSGGQMRRVAIAGVVSMKPDYLILDEPSAGLDPGARRDVFREILSLYKKQGIGIIMVTHSMEDALQFANRLLVVYDGRIIMDGKPAALFRERRKELI